MPKFKHVYCTDCKHFKKSYPEVIPAICLECWYWDVPDSRGNDLRTKYEEKLSSTIRIVFEKLVFKIKLLMFKWFGIKFHI